MTGEKVEAPASPAPGVHVRVPLTVGTTHIDGLTITMMPRATVSGRVVFDGMAKVPAGDQARLIGIALVNMQTTARVEARMSPTGTFEMPDVPPGRYHVLGESQSREWRFSAARSTDGDLTADGLTVTNSFVLGVTLTFTDKLMALSGVVTDDSGKPASDGSVVLMPVNVKGWIAAGMAVQRTKVVQIGPDGSFQMPVDLPGDYLVVAVPPDVQTQTLMSPITVDAEFAVAYASLGTKITFAPGDTKTQALILRRAR